MHIFRIFFLDPQAGHLVVGTHIFPQYFNLTETIGG